MSEIQFNTTFYWKGNRSLRHIGLHEKSSKFRDWFTCLVLKKGLLPVLEGTKTAGLVIFYTLPRIKAFILYCSFWNQVAFKHQWCHLTAQFVDLHLNDHTRPWRVFSVDNKLSRLKPPWAPTVGLAVSFVTNNTRYVITEELGEWIWGKNSLQISFVVWLGGPLTTFSTSTKTVFNFFHLEIGHRALNKMNLQTKICALTAPRSIISAPWTAPVAHTSIIAFFCILTQPQEGRSTQQGQKPAIYLSLCPKGQSKTTGEKTYEHIHQKLT